MNPFVRTQWNGQLGEVIRMLKMGAIMKFMQIMSGFRVSLFLTLTLF